MKVSNVLFFIILGFKSTTFFAQNMGIKLNQGESPSTTFDVNGSASLREGAALVLTNGANNDIILSSEYSFFRIMGPTAPFSITGFTNGQDGRLLTVVNATTQAMTVLESASSTTSNQILTGGLVFTVAPNGSATFHYNKTLTKWVLTGTSGTTNSSNYWNINGNASTTAGTNFIGTTDGQDVIFKVNNAENMRINTAGNMGIGTPSPTNKLSVNGHVNIANHLAIGGNSAINNGSLLYNGSSFTNILSAQEEFTGNQTTNYSEGLLSHISINATNNPTTEFYAIDGISEIKSGNAQNYASVIGYYGGAFHRGSGSVTNLFGTAGFAHNKATGTITNLQGLNAYIANIGSGNIANACGVMTKCINNTNVGHVTNTYGMYVDKGFYSITGSVDSAYGVFIDDQTCSATNSYNIYSKGTNSKNYFDGYVGIGITSPTHILHINGQGRSTNASWTTTSDKRLKNIDCSYEYGLKEILQINTYRFHYKKNNPLQLPTDKAFQGVIAQELRKIIPEAVSEQTDGYLTINNDAVFWSMVNAIKDLNTKNEALKKDIDTIREELSEQKNLKKQVLFRLEKLETTYKQK